MEKKRIVFLAEDVDLLLRSRSFLRKIEKKHYLKCYAPDPILIMDCIREDIKKFDPEIIIFFFPEKEKELKELKKINYLTLGPNREVILANNLKKDLNLLLEN